MRPPDPSIPEEDNFPIASLNAGILTSLPDGTTRRHEGRAMGGVKGTDEFMQEENWSDCQSKEPMDITTPMV